MGQRFQGKPLGRPPGERQRERHSIYMDSEQWELVNDFCKDVITSLYLQDGTEIRKFDVHEEIFAFAADHREEILARLRTRRSGT